MVLVSGYITPTQHAEISTVSGPIPTVVIFAVAFVTTPSALWLSDSWAYIDSMTESRVGR